MAVRDTEEGGLDADVLYIDTEDFWKRDTFDRIFGYFKRRFQLSNADLNRITIYEAPDVFKLGRLFGIEYQVFQSESKVSVMSKFPKKRTKQITKSTSKAEDWITYAPIYKEIEKQKFGLIILDSITVPIKQEIPTDPQHLGGRASLEQSLLAAIRTISQEFKVPFLVTNHGVGMSGAGAKFFGAVKPWGGGAMLYFIKRWIGILECYKPEREKYGDQARRLHRYRWPGLMPETTLAILKKDFGYTDISTSEVSL